MRNRLLQLIFSLVFISALFFGFSKIDDPLKELLQKLERLRTDYPQEKVHLQLDKPYYSIGDTIWFKAYLVNSEKNQLSGLSKILYVELINQKDSIKKSLRLPVQAGLAWGDFTLSDSLSEGNYRIRAYTAWMRNFGEEFFFDRIIKIGNSYSNQILSKADYSFSGTGSSQKVNATLTYTDLQGKPFANKEVDYNVRLNFRDISKGKATTDKNGRANISFVNNQPFILKSGFINTELKLSDSTSSHHTFPVKATSDAVDVQFFPESGNLVNGISSKVAFKAVSANGLGAAVSGYIMDEDNARLVDFKSQHAGMGNFIFTPSAGHHYTAVVKFDDGSEKKFDLPAVQKEGYVLSVNNSNPQQLHIKITASPAMAQKGEVTLIAQSNNVIQYVSKNKFEKPVLTANLPKSRFPTGILHLTLFSSSYQPVAERLVFIQNNDALNVALASDKPAYGKREKVHLDLTVKNEKGNPVQGSFSLAVTDFTKVPVDDEDEYTIFSDLLLTSDLKGYVEQPNYYFVNPGEKKTEELDNLMLTQGWSRFTWRNILAGVYPAINFTPEKALEIKGRILQPNGKPAADAKVTLLTTSGQTFSLDTVTDSEGRFRFSNLAFSDKTSFVVQARSSKGKRNVDIELNDIPPQMVTKSKNEPAVTVNVDYAILPYLLKSKDRFDEIKKYNPNRSILLSEVKVVEKKPVVKHSSNLNGAGNADQVLGSDQLNNCSTLVQCLEGRLVGVMFFNGIPYSTRGGGIMNVMIDGVFGPPDYLNMIAPQDVESIEVLRNVGYLAIYGMQAGNGIIMVNTKRGEANLSADRYSPGILSYYPQGYYLARQFYSPKYDKPANEPQKRDLRTTIFWNPNIITSKEGKASVEFYTADSPGIYRTVVEGLSLDGTPGRQTYQFTIK